uniref:Uncharacterized protein n=1 Tax=Anopheles darlingi TaxID=43151 RepID=A0A2M4D6F6_ANODA
MWSFPDPVVTLFLTFALYTRKLAWRDFQQCFASARLMLSSSAILFQATACFLIFLKSLVILHHKHGYFFTCSISFSDCSGSSFLYVFFGGQSILLLKQRRELGNDLNSLVAPFS